MDYLILGLSALFAGIIDAMVGGGGLIQLPALFSTLTTTAPATLLGTNKLASIWGTGTAAVHFSRRIVLPWNTIGPAALAAFIFAFLGALTVTRIPTEFMRKLLPLILIAVATYTFQRKDFGFSHTPKYQGHQEKIIAAIMGGAIGFYDGFFGPGTGGFLIFLLVRVSGFNFLSASAAAKIINVACNFSALLWFGYRGHVLWLIGLTMALCNVMGAWIGTNLAIRHGNGFVRKIFLFAVMILIVKTSYDAFLVF